MAVQTNESANREYKLQRFEGAMPDRGKITIFEDCFFNGIDVEPMDWDCFRRCYFVGGSLTLKSHLYKVEDCTMEGAKLVTRLEGLPADASRVIARGDVLLNAPLGAVDLTLYDVTLVDT